jgi:tetratricopeptide (TPR) repeat protein
MGGAGFPPKEILPKARAALTRALELDQHLAEAWVLLAVTHVYERDWARAARAVARAIELDPRSGHAYLLSGIVALYGGGDRLDQALVALKRAVELDPLAQMWQFFLAEVYVAQGDSDRSLEQIRAVLEIDPLFWPAHFLRGILILEQGQHAGAVQAFEDAVRCSSGVPFATGYLACALARAGDRPRAERELATLLNSSKGQYVPALSVAFAYLGLGPNERVFEWLERACDELEFWLPWHLQYDPLFTDLRTDSQMIDLVRRLRLPASHSPV